MAVVFIMAAQITIAVTLAVFDKKRMTKVDDEIEVLMRQLGVNVAPKSSPAELTSSALINYSICFWFL